MLEKHASSRLTRSSRLARQSRTCRVESSQVEFEPYCAIEIFLITCIQRERRERERVLQGCRLISCKSGNQISRGSKKMVGEMLGRGQKAAGEKWWDLIFEWCLKLILAVHTPAISASWLHSAHIPALVVGSWSTVHCAKVLAGLRHPEQTRCPDVQMFAWDCAIVSRW